MQFVKFIILMVLDVIFSAGTSYLLLMKWLNDINKRSSCGTGVFGDVIATYFIVGVIFLILLFIYGFIFYWGLFTLL